MSFRWPQAEGQLQGFSSPVSTHNAAMNFYHVGHTLYFRTSTSLIAINCRSVGNARNAASS